MNGKAWFSMQVSGSYIGANDANRSLQVKIIDCIYKG